MSILKSKTWPWRQVLILKWTCVFFGMLAGAWWHEFVARCVWFFAVLVVVGSVELSVFYFSKETK